jgi:hypothetical protein
VALFWAGRGPRLKAVIACAPPLYFDVLPAMRLRRQYQGKL